MRVLLVAPSPPPNGGMALQARQIEGLLRREGLDAATLPSNFELPKVFRPLGRVAGLRTCLRAGLLWFKLVARVRRADVVHVFAASWLYFFVVVYPAVLVGRAWKKRVVLNYHGGQAGEFFARFGRLLAPAFRLADVVTTPSAFVGQAIEARFGVPVLTVPNVLDRSMFSFRARTAIRPTLLVSRHLEKIYDVESVLRAFEVVQKHHADASLWIAGSGSDEARVRQLVSSWNLTNVTFLGNVAHEALPAIFEQRDIYVNASRVDNFPGALLEASAAGLVVVTTSAGGIPFMYEHGTSALLVEPGDWRGLAAAVESLLRQPALARELTSAAGAVVRACDWTEVRKRLFEAYGFRGLAAAAGRARLNGAGCVAG